METTERYIHQINYYLEELKAEESAMDAASELMADAVRKDRLIHIFGTDPHSAAIGDEMFYKGGGLVNINPIYDPAFSFAHGAYRCSLCQTLNGLAPVIIEYYENIMEGDTIILLDSRSDSMMLAQAAEKALSMKLHVIVITSTEGSAKPQWASQIDVLIDNHAPGYDRILSSGNIVTAGMGTILTTAVLNLITAKTVEKYPDAPTWNGNGTVTVDEKPMISQYIHRIKHL